MKHSVMLLLAGSLLYACGPAGQQEGQSVEPAELEEQETATVAAAMPELGSWGVDLSARDLSVEPGDDFFRYANGHWLDNFEIPADRSNHGAFNALRDRSDERVRLIIEELISSEPVAGSMEQKIGDYYRSFMDTETLNELGTSPVAALLSRIDSIQTRADLVDAFGRSELEGSSSPFGFGVSPDRINPDRYQLGIFVGGLSLPDRDYYLEADERFASIRNQFRDHVIAMLTLAGREDSAAMADAVIEIETGIATHVWPRAQRRNRDLTHNPMSYEQFIETYADFDWQAYFMAAGIDRVEELNVAYPSAMQPVIAMVNSIPLEKWKSFLTYKLLTNNASLLSEVIDDTNFQFYGTVLNGIPQQRDRWERGVARVGALNSLGEALGKLYVERYFPESAKQQMEELVENLRMALAESIVENDWMDAATKAEASRKLNSFRPKIAYPDVWEDLSAIAIKREDLFGNARQVREYFYQKSINRIGAMTDREEWGMTPQTVNAYYNSSFNEIVFPAAILQAPFFDPAADMAVNYGAIGGVIGHEMGHGFDDQGSKSDYQGVQRNWWTDSVRAAFEEKTEQLVAQYNAYEPVTGHFIDGSFTLGENIGDVGGLSMAYRAYRIALDGKEAPLIDGLTGDQRFFLAWAQVWQSKIREDALVSRLKSDPHSPAEYRVNGVVRNHDAWYEAFAVKEDHALYLAPELRVRIW
ncbi:MAG: M13 family metallopeptidase [Pseudomonadales bacterium]|nr:M13 family metallopeptidase [Pseudomonadales bacterium]